METKLTSGSGTGTTYPDMDNFGRPTTWDWWRSGGGGAAFYDVDITYDQNSNPTSTTDNIHVRNSSGNRLFDVLYGLDNLNRVISADEGTLSGTISNRTSKETWALSQTGNWTGNTVDTNGDGTNEYNFNSTTFNKANEWTARTNSMGSYTENMTYDANGNMTQWGYREGDGQRYTYTYDAFGRLMKVQTDIGAGAHDHTKYRYNGLGFRIAWQYDTDASQTLTDSERYYFMYDERWRIVGTFRNTDDYAKESFVYHAAGKAGRGDASYIDSVILRDRDTTNGWTGNPDGSLEERRFYCQNWRADVVAITNSNGLPYEFVRYTSYGKAQVFAAADVNRDGIVNATDADDWDDLYSENPSGAAIPVDFNFDGSSFDPTDTDDFNALYSAQSGFSNALQLSSLGNRKGYAGYEFDQAIEAYHVRHRVYLPEIGRWTKRDPAGYVDGVSLYEYAKAMILAANDSTGLYWVLNCRFYFPAFELSATIQSYSLSGTCRNFSDREFRRGFNKTSGDGIKKYCENTQPDNIKCESPYQCQQMGPVEVIEHTQTHTITVREGSCTVTANVVAHCKWRTQGGRCQ
ncbi:MAG: RHS repeat-associated core domain-containing protein [Phycisphaerales bacterium]